MEVSSRNSSREVGMKVGNINLISVRRLVEMVKGGARWVEEAMEQRTAGFPAASNEFVAVCLDQDFVKVARHGQCS